MLLDAGAANESVRFIVTNAVVAILWSNGRNFYCDVSLVTRSGQIKQVWEEAGLGSITIVIDCNRLQLERNRNCNQIFQIVA